MSWEIKQVECAREAGVCAYARTHATCTRVQTHAYVGTAHIQLHAHTHTQTRTHTHTYIDTCTLD